VGATATTSASGEFGTSLKSFDNALKLGVAKTLNNSKYVVRSLPMPRRSLPALLMSSIN
jgi:hypothetical protein